MTFYEAAIEVLRRTGRPLHFKKITEVAIRDEMLSHIGKAPEETMGERLEQETKKATESWVIKTRPGVFTLRDDIIEELNAKAAKREATEAKTPAPKAKIGRSRKRSNDQSQQTESQQAPARDESDDSSGGDDRRRRRRSRAGRDDDSKDSKSSRRGRKSRSNDKKSGSQDSTQKSNRRSKSSSDIPKVKGRFETVSDAAYAVLHATDRAPSDVEAIAEAIFAQKLVKFHTHDRAATVQSAIVTDNQVRLRTGRRPLFASYAPSVWGLTEWGLSDEGIETEKEIQELVADLREDVQTQLATMLVSLKAEALEMMVITLLERLGYDNLKVSKRTSEGDVFFTADWRPGFSHIRVCIQVVGEPDVEIDADDVNELRETLNHYSGNEGILIHLGDVSKAAVKESRDDSKDKVTVIDGDSLVRLLVQEGIGVRTYRMPISMVDTAFLQALQG